MSNSYHSEKRQTRALINHEAILKAAMEVFSEYGFHDTSVESVARRAGVSKGSIYTHFRNKEDLFMSVVEWGESLLNESLRDISESEIDIREKLKRYLRAYIDFIGKRESFFKVIIIEKLRLHHDFHDKFYDRFYESLSVMKNELSTGIENGAIVPTNVHLSAVMIYGMINSLYIDWMHMKGGPDLDTRLDEAIAMIENALFITKGERK